MDPRGRSRWVPDRALDRSIERTDAVASRPRPQRSARSDLLKQTLQDLLKEAGQERVVRFWGELSDGERRALCDQVESLKLGEVRGYLDAARESALRGEGQGAPEPVGADQVCSRSALSADKREEYVAEGLGLIAEGKVGVVLMAGGQGTRLGTKLPKGFVDLGLSDSRTLFRVQAERISRLQSLAASAKFGEGAEVRNPVMWYIMLSDATRAHTERYFRENSYFGLNESQVRMFNQGKLPCVTEQGEVLLESRGKVAEAPDGNGGIYEALLVSGCLQSMRERGVEYVDCYCVDNLLAKIADPLLVGYCSKFGADLGCRTLAKSSPNERVGVFVKSGGGGVGVVEYSELDPEMSARVANPATGELFYNWSNICMQYYTVDFLERVCREGRAALGHHLAVKTIPTVDGEARGVKLEQFIFDVFHLATRSCLLEVRREEEFAPIKSEIVSATAALAALEKKWAESGSTEDFHAWWYLLP